MPRLVLATSNHSKIQEIKGILDALPIEVVASSEYKGIPDIIEDGETFEDNAICKAITVTKATGEVSLADDSGLEVDALHGAPGVYSARFAGENIPLGKERDRANYEKLLQLLKGVKDGKRTARFRCVIAIAAPGGKINLVQGVCEGKIGFLPDGTGGFGYDPVFIPNGQNRSFAALPQDIKNTISHRARALKASLPIIKGFFHLI
ncbi:MAG: RdgB/HAM1 family non-canonical purine NTP pyrophosphatase [Firmicutes bacterium]|jgi:XTP/dITP diphosphohydrolase|nr:RdgB/HAM1 family non-canonical purine NTP pyrophosphatase [Bacillota bacterium]